MISRSLALAFAGLISGTCPDRTGRRTDHSTHVSPGKVPPRAAGGASEADTPGQRVAQHDPVTHEAVQRVLRSEEHTSELQSRPHLVCRLLLEKKKKKK